MPFPCLDDREKVSLFLGLLERLRKERLSNWFLYQLLEQTVLLKLTDDTDLGIVKSLEPLLLLFTVSKHSSRLLPV